MKYIFLKSIKKLQPLLDFEIDYNNIDLHNDFEFINAKIKGKDLEFLFKKKIVTDCSYNEKRITVAFYNILECSHGSQIEIDSLMEGATLVNFARGDLMKPHRYSGNENVVYFFMGFDDFTDFNSNTLVDIVCEGGVIILW